MKNRLFVLLFVALIVAGCTKKQSPPAVPVGPTLGIPMPTTEMLEALGPENNIPIQRLLPNPLAVIFGKPKQLLASPVSTGSEHLVSDVIVGTFPLYRFNPNGIEWFVQSVGIPKLAPVPQDPNNPTQQKTVPIARRATIIAFDQPLDLPAVLRTDDPAAIESMKRTEGTAEYYDLTPPNFAGLLRLVIGVLDEKTIVLVEGTPDDVKAVFVDHIPNSAVLERLKHTPVDSNELTVIASLEGFTISPKALEDLLGQVGRTGRIPANVLSLVRQELRAVSFSLNVSAAVGQPIISIQAEGGDEKSAGTIQETVQGLVSNVQTLVGGMSKESQQISTDFAAALQNAMSAEVKGTQVNVVLNNFDSLIPTVAERLNSIQTALIPQLLLRRRMEQLRGLMELCAKYYQENKKFPSDILDAEGKPLLSWRVALLPSMGFEDLYKKFKLDEPWNSEANLAVLNSPDLKPLIFHPMMEDVQPPKTVIRFFDSAGTPFSKRDLKIEDLKSPETTLMFVVVTPQYAVEWTKPESLEFDIDKVADVLGTPEFWGVTFSGQIQGVATVPEEAKYDEWKQYVESLIKVLP
jgi:hypothetical protein